MAKHNEDFIPDDEDDSKIKKNNRKCVDITNWSCCAKLICNTYLCCERFFCLAFVVFICLACLYGRGFLKKETFDGVDPYQTSLIVLKLPRSGSTWFTELLNENNCIYVLKEIIQRSDLNKYSSKEKEQFLSKALQYPSDKISTSGSVLPSKRFIDDYLLHPTHKFAGSLRTVGFTVNPEHSQGLNWTKVFSASPNMRVISLVRTNIMKMAISSIRGEDLHEKCGVSNLRKDSECNIPDQLQLNISDYLLRLEDIVERYKNFHHYEKREFIDNEMPVKYIYYEQLMSEPTKSFSEINDYLNVTAPSCKYRDNQNITTWIKRTPEDLQQVITNFKELEGLFTNDADCSNLHRQLIDTKSELFPLLSDKRFRKKVKVCINHAQQKLSKSAKDVKI